MISVYVWYVLYLKMLHLLELSEHNSKVTKLKPIWNKYVNNEMIKIMYSSRICKPMLVINCCLERNSQYLKFNLNRIPFQLILLPLQNPKCIFNFLSTIISSKDSLLLDFTRFTFLGITRFFLKYHKIVSYI